VKIVVDTNVIIDFFLARELHYREAVRLFELISEGRVDAFTTASSITDVFYIVAKRLGRDTAKETLRNLFNILGIISVDNLDCFWALDLPITDFEDALVITCANKEHIDYIVTNDIEFTRVPSVRPNVITVDYFLNHIAVDGTH